MPGQFKKRALPPADGQVRKSQLLTTYGPGAIVDLPTSTVIIGGLNLWTYERAPESVIREPRLSRYLRNLGVPGELRAPPEYDDNAQRKTGVDCFEFPQWFLTRDAETASGSRTRQLVPKRRLESDGTFPTGQRDAKGKERRVPVTPVRFVCACRKGHIDDIDWSFFIHQKKSSCPTHYTMTEAGAAGDLSKYVVRCVSCGKQRRMSEAVGYDSKTSPLGKCLGRRPWLGNASEPCEEPARFLQRTATNAYFSQTVSVISLPEHPRAAELFLEKHRSKFPSSDTLTLEDVEDVMKLRHVKLDTEGVTAQEVFERLKGISSEESAERIKSAEFAALSTPPPPEKGFDKSSDFLASEAPPLDPKKASLSMRLVSKVVLVHRLREVIALRGFTRFESNSLDEFGEFEETEEFKSQIAPIALPGIDWLPAFENRGEGIFLHVAPHALNDWKGRAAVRKRSEELHAAFQKWRAERPERADAEPRPLEFYFLHSLSHLLMQSISLACGYPASSLKERIYALPDDAAFGILIYTASPGAEGTMGGLVQAGLEFERHLRSALEMGLLCANDPICAQHDPGDENEANYFLGAACHGCLLVAEPSCEARNSYLDRSLIVPTVERTGCAFFEDFEA